MEIPAAILPSVMVLLTGAGDVAGPRTPPDSPLTMRQVLESPVYKELMTPKIAEGDLAHAFKLPLLDMRRSTPRPTGKMVSLAAFRGRKPVALIFGSYT